MYFTILYYWNDFLLCGSMMEHYRAMCHTSHRLWCYDNIRLVSVI